MDVDPLRSNVPERGVVLVAARQLLDPNFARTVVVLLEHGAAGSAGLIVNQPTTIAVAEAAPALRAVPAAMQATLYAGGPVGPDTLQVLVAAARPPSSSKLVAPGLYQIKDLDGLTRLRGATGHSVHFFAGYAGWGEGQLETEIARGDWHLARLAGADLVSEDAAALWERIIDHVSGTWARGRTLPEGPAHADVIIVTLPPPAWPHNQPSPYNALRLGLPVSWGGPRATGSETRPNLLREKNLNHAGQALQ